MASTPFSDNLRLALKLMSLSAAQLSSELAVDKSVVSRWLNGSVRPSAYNLTHLSDLVAKRVEGFRVLDWERSAASLASMFGAQMPAAADIRAARPAGLTFSIWDQMISDAGLRGQAYEGFFRATRPHPRDAGLFLHEWGMVRRDDLGLLRLQMGSAEAGASGWIIPLQAMIYIVVTDRASGTMMFGIFNGVSSPRVDVFDGLILLPAHDMGRSPMATAMLCERVGDLSGDREADDRHYEALASQSPIAPAATIPAHVRAHLVQDFGPEQAAQGGELFLTLSLLNSMARGRYHQEPSLQLRV